MKPLKNALLSLVLVLASLCVSFILGEIVLRLLGYRGAPQSIISNVYEVDDPILDWRYVPNSEVRLGNLVFKYNQAGFRDVDHDVNKPEGITRIVVVGDSVSEGNGVQSEAVFSRVLQERLGRDYDVINIAMSGLNTPQEVHLFEQHGLQYGPDVVVVNFVLNDIDFYSSLAGQKRYYAEMDKRIGVLGLSISPELKRLLKSSALLYFVKERVGTLIYRYSGSDAEKVDFYTALWSEERNREKAIRGFDQLSGLKQNNSFEVVIMIWPLLVDYADYGYGWIHEWVENEARTREFAAIDLLPAFSEVPSRQLQVSVEDTVHPNEFGHSIAADAFLDWYRPVKLDSSTQHSALR